MFALYILGMPKKLEDFDYHDVELANLFHTVMNQTDFEGVSVSSFHYLLLQPELNYP